MIIFFLLLLGTLRLSQAVKVFQSEFKNQPWVYKIQNTAIGTVTYGTTENSKCSQTCKRGEFCRILKGQAICHPYCGDGIVTRGQHLLGSCDDGNQNPFDGCNKCRVTPGWFCGNKKDSVGTIIKGSQSECSFTCGDGEVDSEIGESCDDGNRQNLDGCTSKCRTVQSWECITQSPVPPALKGKSKCTPLCGDGKKVGAEMEDGSCDDGNKISGDGCDNNCKIQKHFACRGVPSYCTFSCGNGVWNEHALEDCDNGEKKDDNENIVEDGCIEKSDDPDLGCTKQSGWSCINTAGKPSICTTICGDGLIKGSEDCDDGNTINGDGCTSKCKVELGWICKGADGKAISCKPICGDGIRVGEQLQPRRCDDANDSPNDGCDNCVTQRLYTCTGSPSKCQKLCGNALLNPIVQQQCDNGVTKDRNGVVIEDGCDQQCMIVDGWKCKSIDYQKSQCYVACGDGIIDSGKPFYEECDLGNVPNQDCTNCKKKKVIPEQLTVPLIVTRSFIPNQFYKIDSYISSIKQESKIEVRYNLIIAVKDVTESGVSLTGSIQQVSETVTSTKVGDNSKYVAYVDTQTIYYDLLKTGTYTPIDPTKISSNQYSGGATPPLDPNNVTSESVAQYLPVFRVELMRNGSIKAVTFHQNLPKTFLSTLLCFIRMFSPALKAKLYLQQQIVVDNTVIPKPNNSDNISSSNRDYYENKSEKFTSINKDNGDIILIKEGNYSKSTNSTNSVQQAYSQSSFDSKGNLLYSLIGLNSHFSSVTLEDDPTVQNMPMDVKIIQNSSIYVKQISIVDINNLNKFEGIIENFVKANMTYMMNITQTEKYISSTNVSDIGYNATDNATIDSDSRQLFILQQRDLTKYEADHAIVKTNILGFDVSAGGYVKISVRQQTYPLISPLILLYAEFGFYVRIGSFYLKVPLIQAQKKVLQISYKYTYEKIQKALDERRNYFYTKVALIDTMINNATNVYNLLQPYWNTTLGICTNIQASIKAFRSTLNLAPIINGILQIKSQSVSDMSTTLQPIKVYLTDLQQSIYQFSNTQKFGDISSAKSKIAVLKQNLVTDSNKISTGLTQNYTITKNSLASLVSDSQRSQLEDIKSPLDQVVKYFNYIKTRTDQIVSQFQTDSADIVRNLSIKVQHILALNFKTVQLNITRADYLNRYTPFAEKMNAFFCFVPSNAQVLKNNYIQAASLLSSKGYYDKIKNMRIQYEDLQSKVKDMLTTITFPASSACDFTTAANQNKLMTLRYNSPTALLNAQIIQKDLMANMGPFISQFKKILDMNLTASNTLSLYMNQWLDSYQCTLYEFGIKLFGLHRIQGRVWKNSSEYKYYQVKQNFINFDNYLSSQILENELDYDSKMADMTYFENNCLNFLFSSNKVNEINSFRSYKQLLVDLKSNYANMKLDYSNIKKSYLEFYQSLRRQSIQPSNLLYYALNDLSAITNKIVADNPLSQISSTFTQNTNSIRSYITNYQTAVNSFCKVPSFNDKYRKVETYPTQKRAIDQLITFWDEITQIATQIQTAIYTQTNIATLQDIDTKMSTLMNKTYNIAINSTFSTTFKWANISIIDRYTLQSLQTWDLELITSNQCVEPGANQFYTIIARYASMLQESRQKLIISAQFVYKLQNNWSKYYQRVLQKQLPVNIFKGKLQQFMNIINERDSQILIHLQNFQNQQQSAYDMLREIIYLKNQEIDRIINQKISNQYFDLLYNSIFSSRSNRFSLNQELDSLKKAYVEVIGIIKGFSVTQSTANQAIISQFLVILQSMLNSQQLFKPVQYDLQSTSCVYQILGKGISSQDPNFLSNVSYCVQQYPKYVESTYGVSIYMYKILRDILGNLTTNVTQQKAIIDNLTAKITDIQMNRLPFTKQQIFGYVNKALNVTFEINNIFKKSEYDFAALKPKLFGLKTMVPLLKNLVISQITQFNNQSYFLLSNIKSSGYEQPNTRLYQEISSLYQPIFLVNYAVFQEMNLAISLNSLFINYLDTSSSEFLQNLTQNTQEFKYYETVLSSLNDPAIGQVYDVINRFNDLMLATSGYYNKKNAKDQIKELISLYSNYSWTNSVLKSIFTESVRLVTGYNQYLVVNRNAIYTYLPKNATLAVNYIKEADTCPLQPSLLNVSDLTVIIENQFLTKYQNEINSRFQQLIQQIQRRTAPVGQVKVVVTNIKTALRTRYQNWRQNVTNVVNMIQQSLGKGICPSFISSSASSLLSKWNTSTFINFDTFWSKFDAQTNLIESNYRYISSYPVDKVLQWLNLETYLNKLTDQISNKLTMLQDNIYIFSFTFDNLYNLSSQDSSKDCMLINFYIDDSIKIANFVANEFQNFYTLAVQTQITTYLQNVKLDMNRLKSTIDTASPLKTSFVSSLASIYKQISPLIGDNIIKQMSELQRAHTFLKSQPLKQIKKAERLYQKNLKSFPFPIVDYKQTIETIIGPFVIGLAVKFQLSANFVVDLVQFKDIDVGMEFMAKLSATVDFGYGIPKVFNFGIYAKGIIFAGSLTPKFSFKNLMPTPYPVEIIGVRKYLPRDLVSMYFVIVLKLQAAGFEAGFYLEHFTIQIQWGKTCWGSLCFYFITNIYIGVRRHEWKVIDIPPIFSYTKKLVDKKIGEFDLWGWLDNS